MVFKQLSVFIAALGVTGCSGPSSSELKEIKDQCRDLYISQRGTYGSTVKATDHWQKNGKTVIELAEQKSESKSYSSSVCVYDGEKGTIMLPRAFDQDRWSN